MRWSLTILEEGDPSVPLIKIVFALAARKPSLNVVRRAPTKEYGAGVYEIWCAGLSPDILQPIISQETGVWDSLLQASYGWKEMYKTASDVTAILRKSATPGAEIPVIIPVGRDAHPLLSRKVEDSDMS